MIYVIYETATGAVKSFASRDPGVLPKGLSSHVRDVPWKAQGRYVWNAETLRLDDRAARVREDLSYAELIRRLDNRELTSLQKAMGADTGAQRFRLRGQVMELETVEFVNVRANRVRAIVTEWVGVFVADGLVAQADEAARIAALLAPVPEDDR